jgi:hypothetical protein
LALASHRGVRFTACVICPTTPAVSAAVSYSLCIQPIDGMPVCKCGCNQDLSRRATKKHLQGRTVPRLVTAAVKACQALGRTVSPPRLNPPKKLRSSRRYLPSSPTSVTTNGEADFIISEGAGDGPVRDAGIISSDKDAEAGAQRALSAALEGVLSGLHHDADAEEEYDENGDTEGEGDNTDDVDGEDPDGWKLYDTWNEYGDGLSALDTIGEDFERNVIANGKLTYCNLCISTHSSYLAEKLTERDMTILRAYTFKVDSHMTDEAFAKIPYAFPKEDVPTVKVCRSRLQTLSGFKPVRYDCCINSCCCFVGEHKDRTKCPYCDQDRWIVDRKGRRRPRKLFNYLPFIPRLVTLHANPINAEKIAISSV